MPVTLAQAIQNAQTDYEASVITEFQANPLFNSMIFDQAVNPAGGGGTLSYGYRRQVTRGTAAFRAINAEYTPSESTTEQKYVDLAVLGGSYEIDRVLAKIGPAASGEVAFQTTQKIESVRDLFVDTVINGDTGVDANSFDGLAVALDGSSTEDLTVRDWSATMDQAAAFATLEDVDDLLSLMDGEPTMILGNRRAIQRIKSAARWTSQYVEAPGPRNTTIMRYGPAILMDAGYKDGASDAVIPVDGATGQSKLYGVRIALDGFHAITTTGGNVVSAYMPDFTTAGAVKTGEVEMGPVAVALKKTKAAAVITVDFTGA